MNNTELFLLPLCVDIRNAQQREGDEEAKEEEDGSS